MTVTLVARNKNIEVVCCEGVYFRIETIDDGHSVVTFLNSKDAGKEVDFIKLTNKKRLVH